MILQKIYRLLASVKLAIVLLIVILVCCLLGVTVMRGGKAWELIFSTLWFNGLLIVLVLNIAFCFFPRMWGRKLTIITLGMILFHLSFVAMFAGIIYNSLFYFRGSIRLTEGETLPSGDPRSYDNYEQGRFFNFEELKGETTLIKMHVGYKVEGVNKRVAYEIAVGEGNLKKQGTIYITHSLDHRGFSYFNDKEGYSVLVVLCDKNGTELYGAFIPLQSFKQKNDSYLYTTGTKEGPGNFPFPQNPEEPLFAIKLDYHPDTKKERAGNVFFHIWSLADAKEKPATKPFAEGKAAVGEKFKAGDHYLTAKEIRYWVSMNVRYEPGKPIVLTSLWIGLGGMTITFMGRLRKNRDSGKA